MFQFIFVIWAMTVSDPNRNFEQFSYIILTDSSSTFEHILAIAEIVSFKLRCAVFHKLETVADDCNFTSRRRCDFKYWRGVS